MLIAAAVAAPPFTLTATFSVDPAIDAGLLSPTEPVIVKDEFFVTWVAVFR